MENGLNLVGMGLKEGQWKCEGKMEVIVLFEYGKAEVVELLILVTFGIDF
jgi:hypothetical protein